MRTGGVLVAGALFGVLGWWAGGLVREGRPASAAAAALAGPARQQQKAGGPKARRVPSLRALDMVVKADDLRSFSSAEAARFSAKKWTAMLDRPVPTVPSAAGIQQARAAAVATYLEGWLALVRVTTPYSEQQLAAGLADELCGKRPDEQRMLATVAPRLPGFPPLQCP